MDSVELKSNLYIYYFMTAFYTQIDFNYSFHNSYLLRFFPLYRHFMLVLRLEVF